MKRILKKCSFILILLAVLTGCSNKFDHGQNIVLEIDEATLSATGVTYTIHNHEDEKITYGMDYYIQVKDGDAWHDLENGAKDWPAVACSLDGNSSGTDAADWSGFYGELAPGTYRLVKPVVAPKQECLLACEFVIE